MNKVATEIISVSPSRVLMSGGEPLLAPWWYEAARMLADAGIPVHMYSSGWVMDQPRAQRLAGTMTGVVISIDGADASVHDAVRGRVGSFERTQRTLEMLSAVKAQREQDSLPCFSLKVDCTVTRRSLPGLAQLVERLTTDHPGLDAVRFGAVVPAGVAQEEHFVATQVLTDDELNVLASSTADLARSARNGVEVSVTDVRFLLPGNDMSEEGESLAHIEAGGELRAFTTYEAKVGNVLDEPLAELWQRALDWRSDPFVASQRASITTLEDWGRVVRTLDRRYGSAADKERIARRSSLQRSSAT